MDNVKYNEMEASQIGIYARHQGEGYFNEIINARRDLAGTLQKIYKNPETVREIGDFADRAARQNGPYPQLLETLRSNPEALGPVKGTYLGILTQRDLEARAMVAAEQMRRLIDLGRCLERYRTISDRSEAISRVPAGNREAATEQLRYDLRDADIARAARDTEDRDARRQTASHQAIQSSRDPDLIRWLERTPDR